MKPLDATELRVTRRGTIGPCKCKLGPCRRCGGTCRRCKCTCKGYSVLDTIDRIRRKQMKKGTTETTKSKSKPKRKKASDMIINEPCRRSKRNKTIKSWAHLNDDDSTFLPSVSTATNTVVDNVEISNNRKSCRVVVVMRMLLDPYVLRKAITDFGNTLSSLSIPTYKLKMKKLFLEAFESDLIKNAESSEDIIRELLYLLYLPYETSIDLQNLLIFSMNEKKSRNIQYKTRNSSNNASKGKQITSISKLREKFIELTKKCKIVDEPKVTKTSNINEDTTSITINSDTPTIYLHKMAEMEEVLPMNTNGDESNNDQLTEQVLTLPRQFRPIDLKNDQILQNDNDTVNGTISVSTIIVPKLPAMMPDNEVVYNKNAPVNNKVTTKAPPSKIHQLIGLLNQPDYMKRELPSKELRENSPNIEAHNKPKYRRLVTLGYKMTDQLISTLCPGPSKHHLFKDVLKNLSKSMDQNVDTTDSRTSEEKYKQLSTALCLCTKNSKRNSIERRVCRAILYKGTIKPQLNVLLNQHNFKFALGKARARAREDFDSLLNGESLYKPKRSYSLICDEVLQKAVKFILSENNVVSISYGTKKVKLSKYEIIELPSLTRKRSMHDIFKAYIESMNETEKSISRASMFKIMGHLTNHDEAVLTAIDYVTAVLINEPCELLQDIIEKVICPSKQKEVGHLLNSARYFLKHKYKSHALMEDNICYHGLQYCLGKSECTKVDNNCQSCKFPFYVCYRLEELVKDASSSMCVNEAQRDDAVDVIRNTSEKFELFMAHSARCVNQSKGIARVENDIRDKCIATKGSTICAILIVDFKMKYEPKSMRETTVEHYGKRGIGWHGCALIYYLYQQKQDDNNNMVYDNENNEPVMAAKKYIVYVDQILEESNRQDGLVVISLIEAAVVAIHDQLPFISSLIIQSDNANQYQNPHLILGLHLVNMKMHRKIFISEYIHSETQDGKTILDAHFATTNRHLITFMKIWRQNRITKIQTAAGLAFALSFNAGVRNTLVQLIDPNREVLGQLERELAPIVKKMKLYYTRANHIYYQKLHEDDVTDVRTIMRDIKLMRFEVGLQSFSFIDQPVFFQVDIGNNTFEPIESNTDDECIDTIDDLIPGIPENIPPQEFDCNDKPNDFSIHNNNCNKPRIQRHHSSVVTLEAEGLTTNHENDTDDSSDDESYNNLDDSSSSDDDDNLIGTVNISNINLREYGPPRCAAYNVDNMITAVKIIQQQELGTVRSLMEKKKKAANNVPLPKVHILRQDSIAKGVRFGKTVITSSDYFMDTAKNDPMHDIAKDFKPLNDDAFKGSWARRKGHGKLYGSNYIEKYRNELKAMFEEGKMDSSKKMNPGKMRERLLQKFPNHFSIPGDTEIKQFIGAQFQNDKYHGNKKEGTKSDGRGRRPGPKTVWAALLEPFVQARQNTKNSVLFVEFINSLGNVSSWPNDLPRDQEDNNKADRKKVTAAIGNIKQRLKNQMKKALLA